MPHVSCMETISLAIIISKDISIQFLIVSIRISSELPHLLLAPFILFSTFVPKSTSLIVPSRFSIVTKRRHCETVDVTRLKLLLETTMITVLVCVSSSGNIRHSMIEHPVLLLVEIKSFY